MWAGRNTSCSRKFCWVDLRWLAGCRSGQPQGRLPQAAELWVAARAQALTAAMAGWVELRGPTWRSQPRRTAPCAMPDPAVALLALAPAAQRAEWVDVVVFEDVELLVGRSPALALCVLVRRRAV